MHERCSLFLLAMVLTATPALSFQRGDRPADQAKLGRSPALARNGMVATSQPLATAAGLATLRDGGNAVDAALAAAAVLNVVEPMMCGIGGDLFALYYESATGTLHGLNATGRAGSRADAAKLRAEGRTRLPGHGALAVTVPGALDGWDELASRFGTMPLGKLLEPAIAYAEDGFPVSEIIAGQWKSAEDHLARHPAAASVYLVDGGRAPEPGEVFRSPDLARTLRRIADEGTDVFYRGAIADAIHDFLDEEGGLITREDLAAHDSTWVDPIRSTYRGYEVVQIPPNSQGFVALLMLNILEGFDLKAMGHNSAATLHRMIEAKKLAFADRDAWLADPDFMRAPLDRLLSKEYAAERRARIDPDRAAPEVAPGLLEEGDTVYLTVVDKDRNAISLIYSLFGSFGSGLVVPGTGVMLQNRGIGFSLEEGHPNELAPGKRSLHTNMPGMLFRDGRPVLVYGVMGGDMQPQGHAQVLVNLIDFGMNPQQAGEMARFRHGASGVGLESGVDPDTRQALTRMGHRIVTRFGAYGGYQAIRIDWERGALIGASDFRKDGAAMGY